MTGDKDFMPALRRTRKVLGETSVTSVIHLKVLGETSVTSVIHLIPTPHVKELMIKAVKI